MKNEHWRVGDKELIVLSNQSITIIDAADLAIIAALDGTWYEQRRAHTSYAAINHDGTCSLMHGLLTGSNRDRHADHINHNGLDNRRRNLRLVTPGQNAQNVPRARSHSTTGVRGVGPSGDKFRARVTVAGVEHHIGRFDTIEEATAAVVEARSKLMTHSDEC